MEHVIYDNYSLYDRYDDTKQFIIDEYPDLCTVEVEDAFGHISYEPTDNKVWDFIYSDDEFDWDSVWTDLKRFFRDKKMIAYGSIGRWTGPTTGFNVGTFEDLFYQITEDCDYVKITDIDGALHIDCSHHDGSHHMVLKELTEQGCQIYDNWEYSTGKVANYDVAKIMKILTTVNFYSRLPHFWRKAWC